MNIETPKAVDCMNELVFRTYFCVGSDVLNSFLLVIGRLQYVWSVAPPIRAPKNNANHSMRPFVIQLAVWIWPLLFKPAFARHWQEITFSMYQVTHIYRPNSLHRASNFILPSLGDGAVQYPLTVSYTLTLPLNKSAIVKQHSWRQ
jgi:hypothetical protein